VPISKKESDTRLWDLTGWSRRVPSRQPLQTPSEQRCIHEAIHDLESFLWVMTEHAMSRQGPGGKRRDELNPEHPAFKSEANQQLRVVYYYLFGATSIPVLAREKRRMFQTPTDYGDYALGVLHEYFDPIKDYLANLFLLLFLAHRHRLDDVYTPFLRILQQAEDHLATLAGSQTSEAEVKEYTRRRIDLKSLQEFKEGVYKPNQDLSALDSLAFHDENLASIEGESTSSLGYTKSRKPDPSSPTPSSKKQRT